MVTVGYIRGGTAQNIIPETVELGGTMRSYKEPVTALLRERLRSIFENTARAFGVEADVSFPAHYTPATVNDPAMSAVVRDVATRLVGAQNVFTDYRMMGSEDASFFLQVVPGAYVFVGAGNDEQGISEPHHSPRFRIDEDALPTAAALVAGSALRMLDA